MPRSKKPPSAAGRPEIITQDMVDKMVNILRMGAYFETAAALAGIPKKTLYEWLKRGAKEPDTIYSRFSDAMNKAVEECVARDLANIDKAAMGQEPEVLYDDDGKVVLDGNGKVVFKKLPMRPDWGASAWRLERRHAKHWSRMEKQEVVEKTKISDMTEEEIRAELARLEKLADEQT